MKFQFIIPLSFFPYYRYLLFVFVWMLVGSSANAQSFPTPYQFDSYSKINDTLYSTHSHLHTAIKPFLMQDSSIQNALDSFQNKRYKGVGNNFFFRKLFNEHLVEYSKEDYSFYLDFYPDFQLGKEFPGSRSLFTNTRGFQIGGKIGKDFYFQTSYFTNQAKFPIYLTQFININQVVPGQGYIKTYGKDGFDYANAEGYISYSPNKHFTFQVGNGKNFIGDGYRSLLLSDNSFSYPFIKIITTLGPFRYVNMWTQMSDFHNIPFQDSLVFPHKYAVFQYLDWAIGSHINFGFFENIMSKPRDFEQNYINPIVFLVPIQFSIGSPDKVTIGFNGSYKFLNHYNLYGQLVINEFTLSKIFGDHGYWANKQAFQIGVKSFNFLEIKKLNIQLEFNNVRPFTYTANEAIKNYAHYNQPLADPFGANFKEYLGIASYSWKRFDIRAELLYTFYGQEDPAHPNVSYGQDIYKPYYLRASNEGYFIGSGIKTDLWFADLKASYTLNYKNNLRIELGYTNRSQTSALASNKTQFITFGIKGSFRNFYYDF